MGISMTDVSIHWKSFGIGGLMKFTERFPIESINGREKGMVARKEETRWEKWCSWARWVARLEEKQGAEVVNELGEEGRSGPCGTRRWRGRMSLPSSSSIPSTLRLPTTHVRKL
ncbi:hypothetical protein QVD17_21153 [Tagetes erecta]|uniref:Uncharacterized protein n=1 Tax=Tagetes erecta TaxID=13708 RepID=A0AAD8NYQ9_TARER|nr:hypothetical protein QVD17_21153 [Tagetes erecta]